MQLNVPTDPRFGRLEENYSEDPCIVATLGVAAVTALQVSSIPLSGGSSRWVDAGSAVLCVCAQGSTGGPSTYLPPQHIVSEAKVCLWPSPFSSGANLLTNGCWLPMLIRAWLVVVAALCGVRARRQ